MKTTVGHPDPDDPRGQTVTAGKLAANSVTTENLVACEISREALVALAVTTKNLTNS